MRHCLEKATIDQTDRVLVAHACNPSYSGGRDQEDCGSKPAQANSLQDLISKKLITEKGLVEWLKVYTLSSNPRTTKKERKKERKKTKQIDPMDPLNSHLPTSSWENLEPPSNPSSGHFFDMFPSER
jgi:hypothetical protein